MNEASVIERAERGEIISDGSEQIAALLESRRVARAICDELRRENIRLKQQLNHVVGGVPHSELY